MDIDKATVQQVNAIHKANAVQCCDYARRTLQPAVYAAYDLATACSLVDLSLGRRAKKAREALSKALKEVKEIESVLAGK